MIIESNQIGGKVVTISVASESSFSPASTQANTALVTEVVTGLTIEKIFWSGNWQIARGANTYFNANNSGEGHWDLVQSNIPITADATANVNITLISGIGTLICQFRKQSVISNANNN